MTHFNMNNIQGTDADIETSLCEYGLAWILSDDGREFRFWFGIHNDGSYYDRFDWGDFSADLDIYQEFDWADFDDVLSFVGLTKGEWDEMDLPNKISNLISYYGQENVFGECYDHGFKYLPGINRFQSVNY